MRMHISTAMIEQIAKFEGIKLVAYKDVAGVPTIGIGHTGKDVVMGDKISLEEAYRLFRADIYRFENELNKLNEEMLTRSKGYGGLTQQQFDALLSLIYNTGPGAIGANSTLRRVLLNGGRYDYAKITHTFMLWCKITDPVTKQKVVCGGRDGKHGLVGRRAVESAWYVYGSEWEEELRAHKITDVVEWARN